MGKCIQVTNFFLTEDSTELQVRAFKGASNMLVRRLLYLNVVAWPSYVHVSGVSCFCCVLYRAFYFGQKGLLVRHCCLTFLNLLQ